MISYQYRIACIITYHVKLRLKIRYWFSYFVATAINNNG